MNSKRSNIAFSVMFVSAIVLIISAFITIGSSYSLPNSKTSALNWDVTFSDVNSELGNGQTIIFKDHIDMNVSLKDGESYIVKTSLDNNGDIDAYVAGVYLTDLSSIEVGTIDNKTYYASDYVSYTIKYLSDNEPLEVGNIIGKKTKSDVVIEVKRKELKELTEEEINVIGDSVIDLDLSVSLRLVGKE